MEKIRVIPSKLKGKVLVPSSKSMGHREIICAGLAEGTSIVDNISMSKDIEATCRCLKALSVKIESVASSFAGRTALKITGTGKIFANSSAVDCGESGSTLRFFIPLGAMLGETFTFLGHGKLVSRPLQVYYDIFTEQAIDYTNEAGQLPLTVNGHLQAGTYRLPGNVSSQFISGLLFALPLLEGDSIIELTSSLESSSYVDMTLSCLAKYGIKIINENHQRYFIHGSQHYQAHNSNIEGDWSQAAFWAVGGALGKGVICEGVDFDVLQGDRVIVDIMKSMGAMLHKEDSSLYIENSKTQGTTIDAADCPDIIPVLTVLASVSSGRTEIINAGRLRIKECDRLAAISRELNKLGAAVTELPEGLIIEGKPEGLKGGADVDAWNDHRIAMSLAIAAQCCSEPIVLTGAGSVSKSYPEFWQDYHSVGGKIEVLA